MRHRVYGRKLGRNKNQRNLLFRSLMQELFLHGTITTSQAKASAIKGTVDKVITMAKNKNTQRLLQSFFSDKLMQERLIKEIVPKLQNRTSGYTSTIKVGIQEGDRTTLVRMSLIGLEELKPFEKESKSHRVKESTEKATPKEVKKTSETKGRTGQSVRKTKSTKRGTSRLSK